LILVATRVHYGNVSSCFKIENTKVRVVWGLTRAFDFYYHCSFRNNKVSLFQKSNIICSDFLIDNLYKLDLNFYNEILQTSSRGTKWKLNENFASLWHKHLGHISKQRIQKLMVDGIEPLDLKDFQVCLECIKEKRTNERKLSVERAKDVLELIHTDIHGLFHTAS